MQSIQDAYNGDHPRACGEKEPPLRSASQQSGSPPRMRGEDNSCRISNRPNRITPAHAGRSRSPRNFAHTNKDHPRACGEKQIEKEPPAKGTGSPPRMRGEVERYQALSLYGGITPAHAGRSRHSIFGRIRHRDHPRACGEKKKDFRAEHPEYGSPPRMRGEGADYLFQLAGMGITPAHAGRSCFCGGAALRG